jgi:hypothetical protein
MLKSLELFAQGLSPATASRLEAGALLRGQGNISATANCAFFKARPGREIV